MSNLANEEMIFEILLLIVVAFFVFQVIVLLRIRNLLHQISYYIESISRFFYRMGSYGRSPSPRKQIPQTCQFCKHRLSFIHMSENKGEVEDFYYKCQLRNIEVTLDDSCEQFEKDEYS